MLFDKKAIPSNDNFKTAPIMHKVTPPSKDPIASSFRDMKGAPVLNKPTTLEVAKQMQSMRFFIRKISQGN